MPVISVLPDGKVIASESDAPRTIPIGGGTLAVAVSIYSLKTAEKVLRYEFKTDPVISARLNAQNTKITGNVVGVTIIAGAGTTLTTEPVVIGF